MDKDFRDQWLHDEYVAVQSIANLQNEHACKHAFFTTQLPWNILVLHTN